MKKIYLINFVFIAILDLCVVSCKKDLPFPIDDVKRGVAIDVSRIPGTNGVLSDGVVTGDYRIRLTVHNNQGDYSFMSHAQLLAVLTSGGNTTSQVAIDNITTFPVDLTLDIANVYSKFGKTAPALGELLNFTVNIVLKDGSVIPGWEPTTGQYNNARLTSAWKIEGIDFSNKVEYAVSCPFDPNVTFVGTFTCDEFTPYGNDSYPVALSLYTGPKPTGLPSKIDANLLYGFVMDPISPNIWEPTNPSIIIWLNTEDMTLYIPQQSTGDFMASYGGREVFWMNFRSMSVSTCTRTINFTCDVYMPGYGGWLNWRYAIHL